MLCRYSTLGTFTLVFAVTGTVATSCGPYSTSCDDGIGCVSAGGSGNAGVATGGKSAAGSAGKSTTPGGSSAGGSESAAGTSNTGLAGAGGAAGGADGGAGGVAVALPCDGACKTPTPVCDEPNNACVECLKEADCAGGSKKKCDAAKACVECLAPGDCPSAAVAKCEAGTCAKCTSNDDCAHVADKTVCDTKVGECVQCTGKDYAACGASMGKPLVCDSLARTCTSNKERSAGLCGPCVSDAQCGIGQLCAKEQFGSPAKDVGYFCFWQQGAPAGGAPADCTLPANRPYVALLKNQSSVDGTTAEICGLRLSTCTARNQFSLKDCATSATADDSKCGFAPTKDSKCLTFGASQFRCTTTCGSDDDCDEGFPCNTGVSPKVCKLEP